MQEICIYPANDKSLAGVMYMHILLVCFETEERRPDLLGRGVPSQIRTLRYPPLDGSPFVTICMSMVWYYPFFGIFSPKRVTFLRHPLSQCKVVPSYYRLLIWVFIRSL